jgi:integrase/recombinase XerD
MSSHQPDHWIRRVRKYLLVDLSLSPKTLNLYEPLIGVFLRYLGECNISLDVATEADLKNYLLWQRRRYRKLHGREPGNLRSWRAHHAVPIRHLLRVAQGKWPPASPGDELFGRYQEHLIEQGLQMPKEYRRPARLFTDYLGEHGLEASKVQPSDVAEFLRVALTLARQHRPTQITQPSSWNRVMRRTVHAILRFAQGEWPPGSNPSPVVNTFRQYLVRHQYNHTVVVTAVAAVNQFLRHLQREGKGPEVASPADVNTFVQEKRRQYEKRHGSPPPRESSWRSRYTGPIHRMLRLVDPEWPRPEPPRNEAERLRRDLTQEFARWLTEDRGLSEATRKTRCWVANDFLCWLDTKGLATSADFTLVEVDAYLENRLPALRRTSRATVCSALRGFLRFLFCHSRITRDLARAVSGPHVYHDSEIPRAFTAEQIRRILQCTRQDRTPIGRRDYAMLLLFATYGLRAGEVLHLRLDDIDWKEERIRIRHTKTYSETFVPLMAPVGAAIIAYLKNGRPKTESRHVFVGAQAPYQPFRHGGAAQGIIHRRLKQAGITVTGHQGAHAFRYARARSLLGASVPRSVIGNLFGHRSVRSTTVYLKLVTDNLRSIGLDLPSEITKCPPGPTKKKRS